MPAKATFGFIGTIAVLAIAASAPVALAGPSDDYHVALQGVRADAFKRLADIDVKAMLGTAPGDARLPGRLSITDIPGKADAPLAKARRLAGQLAAQRGARSLPATASNRWVAERVRTDLSDYLSQGPSPYLCSGLDNYLGTLRSYTSQLAVTDLRLDEAEAFLAQSARDNAEAALDAMLPPPAPRYAPADRPGMQIAGPGGLPSIDAEEEQGDGPGLLTFVASNAVAWPSTGDFGPAARRPPMALETRGELERAARRLIFAARRGAFIDLDRHAATQAPGRGAATYLAVIAPTLSSVTDPLVRPALINALADIEALDIVMAARGGGEDPVAAALDETMNAIRAAHDTACR